MRFTTPQKNKKASNISLILMLGAVVLFFFAATGLAHGVAVIQLLGVILLAGSAYFIMRAMTIFSYIIVPDKENTDKVASELPPEGLAFIVSKRFGKGKEIYQCKLELSSLRAAVSLPADSKERKKVLEKFGKINLFRYVATVGKCDSVLLVFQERGHEKIGIVVEPFDDMFRYLKTVADINKTGSENDSE